MKIDLTYHMNVLHQQLILFTILLFVFYDVEKYFGSKGSFFNLEPISGTYSFNPPYQADIINKGINKLFLHLDKALSKKRY